MLMAAVAHGAGSNSGSEFVLYPEHAASTGHCLLVFWGMPSE